MKLKTFLIVFFVFFVLLSGCDENGPVETPTPTQAVPTEEPTAVSTNEPEPTATAVSNIQTEGVFISELLPGMPGNNNTEFVELYNAGDLQVDLQGWTLSYLLGEGQAESLIFEWDTAVDIPPFGHILLVREGQSFDLVADGTFDTSLFERKGSLILRDGAGNVADLLGWGSDAPESGTADSPANLPDEGSSMERLPGGEAGNGQQTNNNSADFFSPSAPNPQNSGSVPTPAVDQQLQIALTAPELLPPGEQFAYEVAVTNLSEVATAVSVNIPIADHFELIETPDGAELENGRLSWTIATVGGGETAVSTVTLQSPFTYIDALVSSYYAEADGFLRAYGGPQLVQMGGGSVPIAIARGLIGSTVTVEGVATMYTGGFFGGSTSNKFYMEDETAGIQVYIPGGQGIVDVEIGDVVRVTGELELFRDSLELIPIDSATDVEIVGESEPPIPALITAIDNENDDSLLGRLNVIEGIATRIQENNFDYEIDILDDAGDTTLILLEKDTGATVETMTEGTRYQIVGVTEFYQERRQLKPRLQSDIREVFPPILLVSQQGQVSADGGDELTYTITVFNHSPNPMTAVSVSTPLITGATLVAIDNEGQATDNAIVWTIDELAGDSASVELRYTVQLAESASGAIVAGPVTAVSDQWPDPATTAQFITFVGDAGVPIWAIQGDGERSPYVQSTLTTSGVVTGVVPELNGFWIQETDSDNNALTSAGLFVFMDQIFLTMEVGDMVEVTAVVREISGQTALAVDDAGDVVLLSNGNGLPSAQVYDPPADPAEALLYNESLEGMLVTIAEPALVVGPTTRFGEITAVYPKWGVSHVARTDEVGFLMYADDGSSVAHDEQASLPYVVKSGDQISGLTGPLAYTFGNYKIAPTSTPEITSGFSAIPTFPIVEDDQLSIVTFNIENMFDFIDPHPSSPEPPLPREYRAKLNKLAQAIQLMGFPTVIGVQEVENIGVLEDLAQEELLLEWGYQPYLIEGFDSRGIDVGYLVRGDQATVELVSTEGAEESLFARPPLLLQLTLSATGETVYLLNNHFLSLSAGEEATEPTRTAQAQWNADIVTRLAEDDPAAHFVVLGDLNSFYQTLPVDTLQNAGLRHVYEFVDEQPYTYIFEGRTQTLDHILLSDGLFERVVLVTAVHINADYPIADPESTAIERSSDHDPLMVVISLE